MLNRRQLLRNGAIIAGGACLPQSFWADDKQPFCGNYCHWQGGGYLQNYNTLPGYHSQVAHLNAYLANRSGTLTQAYITAMQNTIPNHISALMFYQIDDVSRSAIAAMPQLGAYTWPPALFWTAVGILQN